MDSVGTADTEAYDSFNLGWARMGNEIRSSWLIVLTAILSAQQALQAALGS